MSDNFYKEQLYDISAYVIKERDKYRKLSENEESLTIVRNYNKGIEESLQKVLIKILKVLYPEEY